MLNLSVCWACSFWLRARIIQSGGISAHWEENRRTQVPPVRTHVVVQIPPNSAILQTKFKHIYCDINKINLPLILMFSLWRLDEKKLGYMWFNVGDRMKENNDDNKEKRGEPDL